MKTSDFRSWHVFQFQLQNLVPLSQLLKCGKWSMPEFCNWSSRKVINSFQQFSSAQGLAAGKAPMSCVMPNLVPLSQWCPAGSTLPQQWQVSREGAWRLAQSGQGQSLPRKTRKAICLLTSSPPLATYPQPSVMTFSCSHFWQLPDTVSQTSLEANYHTNCQRQKTLPDCCPTSAPAYKSFLNKTALNKQKCNSNVYTTLWGN